MQIGVIGINHKTATLELLENFTKASLRYFNGSLHPFGLSFVLLTTCNRAEIYFSSEDLAASHTYLLGILREEIAYEFEHRVYAYFGSDCFCHLARVTSGLDSALLGETEIQGQVKRAYEAASAYRSLPAALHYLFQKSLKMGKNVRGRLHFTPAPSLEKTVFKYASTLLEPLEKRRILFVGISEINRKILRYFCTAGLGQQVTVCNRTLHKAAAAHSQVLPWQLHDLAVSDYDMLIYGTQSPTFLLTRPLLKETERKKLVIDLSIPRNVDPCVARVNGIELLNIDQLNRITASTMHRSSFENDGIAYEVDNAMALFKKKEAFFLSHSLLA